MATLLDDPKFSHEARRILEFTTRFEKEEFDWSGRPDKQDFLDFFYKNKDKIQFDPILGVWLLTPPEQAKLADFFARALPVFPNPEKQFSSLAAKIRADLEVGDTAGFSQNISKMADLRSPESKRFLLDLAKNEAAFSASRFPKNYSPQLVLLQNLRHSNEPEMLDLALKWLKNNKFSASDCEIPMSELFNHYINNVEKTAMLRQLQGLLDSFKTTAAVRANGYELACGASPFYFDEAVDFYGFVAAKSFAQPWARNNSIENLIASRHPRSLYYLAARVFRARFSADSDAKPGKFLQPFLSEIENLTRLKIAVPDSSGATVTESADEIWLLNYAKYWAIHWPDYEWDVQRGIFINKLKAETISENYERLFRRLTATNDTAAMDAFRMLAEGNPVEVSELAGEFRQTVRDFNPRLPSFKFRFLEQLTLFTEFCREVGEDWKPGAKLADFLKKLDAEPEPKKRYVIENQMIASLALEDLTALEFETLLREPDKNFAFSAARVLDWVYSKHWPEILGDDDLRKIYLKKSAIFAGIKANGTLNFYADRFRRDDFLTQKMLEKTAAVETDLDILILVKKLLEKSISQPARKPESVENEAVELAVFQKKMESIFSRDSISVEQINQFISDKMYRSDVHKFLILNNLDKIRPIENLHRLNANPKFSGERDFMFFEKLKVPEKRWPEILRLFDGTGAEAIFDFLVTKTDQMNDEERGFFFNETMRNDWVLKYFNQLAQPIPMVGYLKFVIQKWHDSATDISEFDEETVLRNLLILENIGQPIASKIAQTKTLEIEERTRFRVQREILAAGSFSDLKTLAPLLNELSADENGNPGYHFLTKDFGFPPLDFSETVENERFKKVLAEKSETEVYKFYLRSFGVKFENEKTGALDLEAIRQILRHDLLTPFVGSGGERRDWYVFAVVKILENEFGTTLGFHKKLNENQTFYTFNAGKRAAAWLGFLEKK